MLDLTDRTRCFYWQTDRQLSPNDYLRIFLKRHDFPQEELTRVLKNDIHSLPTDTLQLIPADENVVKGNVNIVRKISINGTQYVVRVHPKGVKNGYFYVEKVALDLAKQHGLPVPEILEIHEAENDNDMDLALMSVVEGNTMDVLLSKDNSPEKALLFQAGTLMAKVHDIRVDGFGFFDNTIAKKENKLIGIHKTNNEFIHVALEENLQRLVALSVSTQQEVQKMQDIMDTYSFESVDGARIVHNDFADWNLLTNGTEITGILDWDECCGGDPIADLACWSMFFNIDRYEHFLKGYESLAKLPDDYEKRFHYYRLRYAISKMALRAKRFLVDPSEEMKAKMHIGKEALIKEVEWLNNND
ncbi:MAG TPA: aminoglycoside phosphotransferase family protein [Candidatus Eisenbacteria bacterium]|nr:aminoglycoside phosphotransferase family protein [Candidatus Eisenbacteria bacterium]